MRRYQVAYPMGLPVDPVNGFAGIRGEFIKGFVATGTLTAIQARGMRPAVDRRTLRLALQGGIALATGAAVAEAWRSRAATRALGSAMVGVAALVVTESLMQERKIKEIDNGQEEA